MRVNSTKRRALPRKPVHPEVCLAGLLVLLSHDIGSYVHAMSVGGIKLAVLAAR